MFAPQILKQLAVAFMTAEVLGVEYRLRSRLLRQGSCRAVSNGRRILGNEKAKDIMCVRTQKRRGFRVESLPTEIRASHESLYGTVHGQQEHDAFEERLCDNTLTPVPDQAAFRIDWPAWMKTCTDRDRRIMRDLMVGERTLDVSRKYRLSPGRISQLRRELHADRQEFCAAPDDEDVAAWIVSASS